MMRRYKKWRQEYCGPCFTSTYWDNCAELLDCCVYKGVLMPKPRVCRGEECAVRQRGSVYMNTFFSSLSSQTGGSLLAGHMRWRHQPSLLCSGWHRFNKEEFVQHLFICKSRVWHGSAGSSRPRWVDSQGSWRLLTIIRPAAAASLSTVPHPSHHHPLLSSVQVCTVFPPRTSKRRRQRGRLQCRGHQFFLFLIFNAILRSKEDALFILLTSRTLRFLLAVFLDSESQSKSSARSCWFTFLKKWLKSLLKIYNFFFQKQKNHFLNSWKINTMVLIFRGVF